MLVLLLLQLLILIVKVVGILVAVAYYTIAERKIMGAIHRRRGPNVVGFYGLLQPLADGLKLLSKELVVPSHANSRIFTLAPIVILTLSLVGWSVLPFDLVDYSTTLGHLRLHDINAQYLACPFNPTYLETALDYFEPHCRVLVDIAWVTKGEACVFALVILTPIYGAVCRMWQAHSSVRSAGLQGDATTSLWPPTAPDSSQSLFTGRQRTQFRGRRRYAYWYRYIQLFIIEPHMIPFIVQMGYRLRYPGIIYWIIDFNEKWYFYFWDNRDRSRTLRSPSLPAARLSTLQARLPLTASSCSGVPVRLGDYFTHATFRYARFCQTYFPCFERLFAGAWVGVGAFISTFRSYCARCSSGVDTAVSFFTRVGFLARKSGISGCRVLASIIYARSRTVLTWAGQLIALRRRIIVRSPGNSAATPSTTYGTLSPFERVRQNVTQVFQPLKIYYWRYDLFSTTFSRFLTTCVIGFTALPGLFYYLGDVWGGLYLALAFFWVTMCFTISGENWRTSGRLEQRFMSWARAQTQAFYRTSVKPYLNMQNLRTSLFWLPIFIIWWVQLSDIVDTLLSATWAGADIHLLPPYAPWERWPGPFYFMKMLFYPYYTPVMVTSIGVFRPVFVLVFCLVFVFIVRADNIDSEESAILADDFMSLPANPEVEEESDILAASRLVDSETRQAQGEAWVDNEDGLWEDFIVPSELDLYHASLLDVDIDDSRFINNNGFLYSDDLFDDDLDEMYDRPPRMDEISIRKFIRRAYMLPWEFRLEHTEEPTEVFEMPEDEDEYRDSIVFETESDQFAWLDTIYAARWRSAYTDFLVRDAETVVAIYEADHPLAVRFRGFAGALTEYTEDFYWREEQDEDLEDFHTVSTEQAVYNFLESDGYGAEVESTADDFEGSVLESDVWGGEAEAQLEQIRIPQWSLHRLYAVLDPIYTATFGIFLWTWFIQLDQDLRLFFVSLIPFLLVLITYLTLRITLVADWFIVKRSWILRKHASLAGQTIRGQLTFVDHYQARPVGHTALGTTAPNYTALGDINSASPHSTYVVPTASAPLGKKAQRFQWADKGFRLRG